MHPTCRGLGGCHSIIIINADVNYVDIPALLSDIVLPSTTASGRILIVYHIFKNFIIDLRIRVLQHCICLKNLVTQVKLLL